MLSHHASSPRFTPIPARIPPDPAAQDHRWPECWPLRTQLELAALDTAPGCARAHVRAILREWQADADATDLAALVVSELLTNAVLSSRAHGCVDPVRMWMLNDGANILVLVWDATMPAPVLATAAPNDEHGRGLILVNDVCEQWGFYHPAEDHGGKVVWALLRADPTPEAA
jgi:anti-sigma regulatory factor (Ser/Thr protein kinase)